VPVQPIIPPEWGWAYDIAVGQDWPQADEDALRRVAQAWTDAMEALLTVAGGGDAAARNVNYSVQSVSSDEFNNYWSGYVDGDNSAVGQMAQQCENLATQCLAFAEQTEFTKLSIDIQLILLFIQLAIDLVLAFVTFGASTSEGVLASFITRLTVRGFLTELLKAVLMAVLPDVITQVIMLSEGHRASFDVGETLQAAQMGVIGGLVGAGLGAGLGKLGTTEFFDSVAGKFLSEDASKFAGGVTNAALHGALTNVGTNLAASGVDSVENQIHAALDPVYAQELRQEMQDQGYADQKSGENPLIAALNGAFTGALFHTVDETSFALAGNAFGATPLTLTDSEGNQQQLTALPIGDDGAKYALFDQSHQFVGKATVGDDGAITITPNNGSPYSARVRTLGEKQYPPADAGPVAQDAPTELASAATPSTDQPGHEPIPPVPADQQTAVAPEQPAESATVPVDQPAPAQPPPTAQSAAVPLADASVPHAEFPASDPHPLTAAETPVGEQPAPVHVSQGSEPARTDIATGLAPHPTDISGATELSSVPTVPARFEEHEAVDGEVTTGHRNPVVDALTDRTEFDGRTGPPVSQEYQAGGSSAAQDWPADLRETTVPGHPEWNGKVHVKDGCVVIGDDPELAEGAARPTSDGTLLVKVHGQGGEIYPDTDARAPIDVADPAFRQALEAAGWREGQPIVLAACEAAKGDNPVDLRLMQALHTEVIASDETVWQDRHGNLVSSPVDASTRDGRPRPEIPPSGSWSVRHLDGSREELPSGDIRRPPVPDGLDREGDYQRLSAGPLDIAGAVIDQSLDEIRQVFPKQAIYRDGDRISIVAYEEIISEQHNLIGETTGTGKSSRILSEDHVRVLVADASQNRTTVETMVDPASGEYSVVIPEGTSPDEVTRMLARALGDIYAARHPESAPSGAVKELDALSMLSNRAEAFAVQAAADGDDGAARAWADEADRLREEFRARAEAAGIVQHEGAPPEDARARRYEAWPGMSDSTRRLATELAHDQTPSFLPGAGYFKEQYNRLDSLAYYLEKVTAPDEREEFLKEILPEVTAQDFPGEFKKTYKEFLPSISREGPLTPERSAEALSSTSEISRKVEDAYAEVVDWAERHGIFQREGTTVDEAVAIGEAEYRLAYERTTARIQKIVAEVAERYEITLDYVGSMRSGSRGPHKGGVHANLDDFDLDLFIVDRDWYDMEYLRAMTFFPDQVSRAKILSDDPSVSQPELNKLNAVLVAKLGEEFRINQSVLESRIALRREPPPPRRSPPR